MNNTGYWTLLKTRPQYRLLWLAQVVSLLGDWFGTIAAIVLINRLTDSGLAISVFFLARGLPSFLFGPVAGVVADRFNRKIVLVSADVLQTVVGFAFLVVAATESLLLLYILTTIQFCLSSFFEPARAAILPNVIRGNQELLLANTLSSTTWSAMLAIGAAIGGFTTAIFGVEFALVINALTFIISALLISQIKGTERQALASDRVSQSGYLDFIDGLKYVWQHPRVGVYATVKGLSQIGSVDTLFTLYVASIFVVGTDGALTLGILYMAFGLGAVLGPVVGNWFSDSSDQFFRRWILLGFIMLPIGWLAFASAPTLGLAALAMVIRAMGGSINWTYSSVQLQLHVPDQFLGRVFALDFSFFTLCYTIAVVATGLLSDSAGFNPREVSFAFGISAIPMTLLWLGIMRWQTTSGLQKAVAGD